MERKGWIVAKWETAEDWNRGFKYYWLTPASEKQLVHEKSR
jgi:PadR family transcriptional regulator PadR